MRKITTIVFITCLFLMLSSNQEANAANPHFGVVCHFQKGKSLIKKDLDLMKDAGIGWRRFNIKWSSYEKDKAHLDRVILEANRRNINLLAMIIMGKYSVLPEQGVKNRKFLRTIQDFEKFVADISERYDGDGIKDAPDSPVVTYWQIENEETGPSHFWKRTKFSKSPGPATGYVKVLEAAYTAIKANQPGAKVLLGGLGGYDRDNYLEGILKAGGGKYFDILDFHIYLDFPSFWHVIKVEKKVAQFRDILKKYGLSKPIWATEMTTGQSALGKKAQADGEKILAELVVKRYVTLLSEDVERAFWKYFDTPKVPGGLLNPDLSPKLAYNAYGVMTRRLGGFLKVEDLSRKDLSIFKFINSNKKEVFVVWAEQKQVADLGLGAVTVTNMFGKTIAIKGPFSVDRSPIYVEKVV
jgi:hypothetical protein